MDIGNYIEILSNKKQNWFSPKKNLEEKLIALTKISENGSPTVIHSLIPFLKDKSPAIRNATCNTIIELFAKIETKKGYYNALKHCGISKSDLELYENTFTHEQFIQLLAIASLNSNGYVREEAVRQLVLSNDEKAIPFIIYRLADWVQAVRQSAFQGIEYFKKPQFIHAIVDQLSIFEWLQKVERTDLSAVYNGIINFILTENKEYVSKNFSSFSDKARLLLAGHISNSGNTSPNDVRLLLNDRHFLIRNFSLQHFDRLSESEINNLLKDKSARVRIQTLYKLKGQAGFIELIHSFLTDTSASIRAFARFSLKNVITDFATIYNENLKKDKEIFASLCGLAETDGKQFSESVAPFLQDTKIKIKKTAFLALTKLNEQKAYVFAIENLDNEFAGIRNAVIEFLQKNLNSEVLERARGIYKNGKLDVKRAMLSMFGNIGGWATIADIIIGTIDENEHIRNLSLGYLQLWKTKVVRLFTQPKAHELDRAREVFSFAFEIHEDKKYFKKNPLTGLDFYLR
jgi:HEAT repeat protein